MLEGVNPTATPIRTSSLSPTNPGAEAVTVATPKSIPLIWTGIVDVVVPSGTITLVGSTVSFDVSLLERITNTPPGGAGFANARRNGFCSPGKMVTPAGSVISANVTVTFNIALETF